MADERLKRLALQWGAIGLLAQLYLASNWLAEAVENLNDLLTRFNAPVLKDRISQLKPAAFKFPWTGMYMILFALVALAIVAVLIVRGWREAFPGEETD